MAQYKKSKSVSSCCPLLYLGHCLAKLTAFTDWNIKCLLFLRGMLPVGKRRSHLSTCMGATEMIPGSSLRIAALHS